MAENRTPSENRPETNLLENLREKAEPVIDKITETAKPVIDNVVDAAKPVIEDIAEAAKPALDKVVDAAKRVGGQIDEKIEAFTDGEKNDFFRDLAQQAQDSKAKAAADADAMQEKLRELMRGDK